MESCRKWLLSPKTRNLVFIILITILSYLLMRSIRIPFFTLRYDKIEKDKKELKETKNNGGKNNPLKSDHQQKRSIYNSIRIADPQHDDDQFYGFMDDIEKLIQPKKKMNLWIE